MEIMTMFFVDENEDADCFFFENENLAISLAFDYLD
jgi:hypothetical protein